MALVREGASLDARYTEPAIDLATLVTSLGASIRPTSDPATSGSMRAPLLTWDAAEHVLRINTWAVLSRFWKQPGWRSLLDEQKGFVRDAPVPRSRLRAHVGGRIVPETESALRRGIEHLVEEIDSAIDLVLEQGLDGETLGGTPTRPLLEGLARQVGCRVDELLVGETRVERVTFGPVGSTQRARQHDVARVMTAVEDQQGDRGTHIDLFATAIRGWLEQREYDEPDIQAAVRHHRDRARAPDTQLARFFDFLEDEALARIRTQVGHRMMDALADEAARRRGGRPGRLALFESYARRAVALLDSLARPDLPDVLLDPGADYPDAPQVSVHEHAIRSTFEQCLPVWPEWVAQLFERRTENEHGARTVRQLSYRFRVNGQNPETRTTAFVARLARMRDRLLGENATQVTRALAELVFLATVVPNLSQDGGDDPDIRQRCERIGAEVQAGGKSAVARLLEMLEDQSTAMDQVAAALIELLRAAGTPITGQLDGRTWIYHLNVLRSLVNRQRIASPLDNPLDVGPTKREEQIGFYNNLRITADRPMDGALLSLQVTVRLAERALHLTEVRETFGVERRLPERLSPVVWRLHDLPSRDTGALKPSLDDRVWLTPGRVEIQVVARALGDPLKQEVPNLLGSAASRTAFATLVYVALQRLLARVPAASRPAVCMLRIQGRGREAGAESGEEGFYAAAQAVEVALGREADVRMQGLVLDDQRKSKHQTWGTFGALLAAFPVRVTVPSDDRPPVGVITFAARPANDHPDHPDQEGRRLFLLRSYHASPTDDGYEVSSMGSRTEVADALTPLPNALEEEVRRLYDDYGCRHIVLLAHRFAERRVGLRASRVRLQGQGQLLHAIGQAFPDLLLYPLVRDTFHATRLRRTDAEAFEIVDPDDHTHIVGVEFHERRHEYTPVFSLATLQVVGESVAARKPQSGFCTYFLLHDENTLSVEAMARIQSTLLLREAPVRRSLQAVLRAIHYLEAERSVTVAKRVRPVLDPYDWMLPEAAGKVGEVLVFERSRRGHGSVALSITAALELVSRALHARRADP